MASEEAPLLPSSQHINQVQSHARSLATNSFYTSHTVFILSLVLSAAKVTDIQALASTVVLSFKEDTPKKPLKLWLAGILLQDLCYFVFLLSKIPYVKRLQQRLVLEVPYSVFTLDLMFTM